MWGVSLGDMIPEVWAVEMWRLHDAVSRHDMLFCMKYTGPAFVAEGAAGGASGDFVAFFVHVLKYLVFAYVVLLASGAVPVFFINVSAGSYAVVEYPHHTLRWSSSLLVSRDLMFIRCFSRVFLHMSAQCCCVWWDQGNVLVRMCVLRLFMFARGMGKYGHCTLPMVVFRCMRAVCE